MADSLKDAVLDAMWGASNAEGSQQNNDVAGRFYAAADPDPLEPAVVRALKNAISSNTFRIHESRKTLASCEAEAERERGRIARAETENAELEAVLALHMKAD